MSKQPKERTYPPVVVVKGFMFYKRQILTKAQQAQLIKSTCKNR